MRIRPLALAGLLAAGLSAARGAEPQKGTAPPKMTHVYKKADGVEIAADVYLPAAPGPRPVLVWIHGGALILGSRANPPGRLRELCREEGAALVSIDYRLAPEAKLPAIAEDVRDALRWVREAGPGLFGADASRIVVSGGSAGGYLTLLSGHMARPRPRALLAYWGYGDVDGEWYTRPSAHYRTAVPLVDRERAYRGVGTLLTATGADPERHRQRQDYYHYLRQNGLWTREVTGFDPAAQRERLDPYCPVGNVTPEYPPVLMVHGTIDTDVPYEQSAAMARELERHRVAHELVTVPGAGHGLAGGNPDLVAAAHARAAAFLRRHLAGR